MSDIFNLALRLTAQNGLTLSKRSRKTQSRRLIWDGELSPAKANIEKKSMLLEPAECLKFFYEISDMALIRDCSFRTSLLPEG